MIFFSYLLKVGVGLIRRGKKYYLLSKKCEKRDIALIYFENIYVRILCHCYHKYLPLIVISDTAINSVKWDFPFQLFQKIVLIIIFRFQIIFLNLCPHIFTLF